VISSDDHELGHVDGFVVDSEEGITHLVLEHGHLWGKRDVTIPISAVDTIANDEVRLTLTKDQVGEIKSVHVRRW
jgi:sporulation protein YlmC with PRC-barrel domain